MTDTNNFQALLVFLGIVATQGVTYAAIRYQAKRAEGKIDAANVGIGEASDEAKIVAKRVEPVSNGFAGKVLNFLEEAKRERAADRAELRKAVERFDRHIGDHASADVRRHTD